MLRLNKKTAETLRRVHVFPPPLLLSLCSTVWCFSAASESALQCVSCSSLEAGWCQWRSFAKNLSITKRALQTHTHTHTRSQYACVVLADVQSLWQLTSEFLGLIILCLTEKKHLDDAKLKSYLPPDPCRLVGLLALCTFLSKGWRVN